MIVKTTKVTEGRSGIQPVGTIISHPEAYRLVQTGVAEAHDDECKDKLREIEAAKVRKRERAELLNPKPVVAEPALAKPIKQEKQPAEEKEAKA